MEKTFKIGEISKLYNIGVDSLRYYEETGLIKPQRTDSGYRLYTTHDIWRLNVIRELREIGFSMGKIKEYLDNHNVDSTVKLLEEEKKAIDDKLAALNRLKKEVRKKLDTIKTAENIPLDKIILKKQARRRCFSIAESYSDEHEMDVLIKRLLNIDKSHFYVIGNNQIGTVIPLGEIKQSGKLKYQSVFIIDENGKDIINEGTYLSVSYKGSYDKSREWIFKLLTYAGEHLLMPAGDILEILWVDIHTSSDRNEHITELQIPVKKCSDNA